jgi:hypothetical protein
LTLWFSEEKKRKRLLNKGRKRQVKKKKMIKEKTSEPTKTVQFDEFFLKKKVEL